MKEEFLLFDQNFKLKYDQTLFSARPKQKIYLHYAMLHATMTATVLLSVQMIIRTI